MNLASIWSIFSRNVFEILMGLFLLTMRSRDFSTTTCRLRHRDPLSPWLFILVEEVLSWNLSKLAADGVIKSVFSSISCPSICHSLYADEILHFFRALPNQATKLAWIIHLYQEGFGQIISTNKSSLLFGKCNPRSISKFKAIFNFNSGNLPCRYLGAPLLLRCPRKTHFEDLLASIKARLGGWKAKGLSFADRLVLIKHVLSSMPLHIAMVRPLLKSTCHSIKRLMRNFLWSRSEDKQRSHYVNWKRICLSKQERGLGIRYLSEVTNACLLKLGCRAISSFGLWASWLCSRYLKNGLFQAIYSSPFGSYNWKRIRNHLSSLQCGIKWSIGTGRSVNLWHDKWIQESSLASLFPNLDHSYPNLVALMVAAND